MKHVDFTFLKEFCKGNEKKMSNYVVSFLNSFPQQLIEMNNQINKNDWEGVKSSIHSIKPQLVFIGLNLIHEIMERIEVAAGNTQMYGSIPELNIELNNEIEKATKELIDSLVTLQ
jgi:HPt (histidine-containing phosphotransfer) domain-containing protein